MLDFKDQDGDQRMEDFDQSERGRGQSSRWGGRTRERGGRGGGSGVRFDHDVAMSQDTTTVLLVRRAAFLICPLVSCAAVYSEYSGYTSPSSLPPFLPPFLQSALGQRYDVNTKSLDLSSMYFDPRKSNSTAYLPTNIVTLLPSLLLRSEGGWCEGSDV